jgi:hypothetical protein
VADKTGVFGFGAKNQPANSESTMIRWGYEGLPNNDTTAYYTYQFFYQDQSGDMVDVTSYTNFMVETSPGSGEYRRIEARTQILEYQPHTSQYLPTNKMMALGIDWCEKMRKYQLPR